MNVSRREVLVGGSALVAMSVAKPAFAEEYPSRPIELVVPWGPGGGADQLARKVAQLGEPQIGKPMPVVNIPGGTGATGMAKILANPADGQTAAIYIADAHALLAGKSPRWTMEDITPVAVLIQAPSFIFVAQDSPFKTWDDFAKAAQERPGALKVATLGFGSVDDFTLSFLGSKGVKVNQVPFSKPSERYVSILGGHADALYEQAGDVGSFLNGKQMRPLLVFGSERFAAFPDVPCSNEAGFSIALPQFRSIIVRGGTPPERVKKLSDALQKVAATDEFKAFLKEQFAKEDSFIGSDGAGAFVAKQLDDMKAAIKQAT
ncbi:Bug family tripartite tricarboxylate transporter substrate binding protein [Hansschlegelia beijingensis]|uniref:Bug family tripartite tricarboxylate transporter substrate binding protein n=1 Tax=Hansschlegelia beijingensis TaxID=1133344 RepID=UPI00387F342E